MAFDGELISLCSFGRRHAAFPLPAGLIRENIESGHFEHHQDMPCALYSLLVPEDIYQQARCRAGEMLLKKYVYHYSIRGLAMCRLGMAENRPQRYFCSQFVAELLESTGAVSLQKPPSLTRPQDFTYIPELGCLYRGTLSGLCRHVGRYRHMVLWSGDNPYSAYPATNARRQ